MPVGNEAFFSAHGSGAMERITKARQEIFQVAANRT